MLGPDVQRLCEVRQHDALNAARHRQVGTVLGTHTPALIESGFLDQDVRITTGFIEPHFFAGFSGGPKMVAPGLAATRPRPARAGLRFTSTSPLIASTRSPTSFRANYSPATPLVAPLLVRRR